MSTESSSFPIDWSPSPLLCMLLCALGLLAALSIWLSNLPWGAKLVSIPCVLTHACGLARREWQRLPCTLHLSASDDTPLMKRAAESLALSGVIVRVRGGSAWLLARAENGRAVRLLWPPDRLGARERRALRLASGGGATSFDPTLATLSG